MPPFVFNFVSEVKSYDRFTRYCYENSCTSTMGDYYDTYFEGTFRNLIHGKVHRVTKQPRKPLLRPDSWYKCTTSILLFTAQI